MVSTSSTFFSCDHFLDALPVLLPLLSPALHHPNFETLLLQLMPQTSARLQSA